jgi:signal peptidase I
VAGLVRSVAIAPSFALQAEVYNAPINDHCQIRARRLHFATYNIYCYSLVCRSGVMIFPLPLVSRGFWRLAFSLCLGISVSAFAVHSMVIRVSGESMEPTLADGAWLVTIPYRYWSSHVPRNRVLIIEHPRPGVAYAVKRLIGIPGDCVDADGLLAKQSDPMYCVPIPANSYFVLGDNLQVSSDSRDWGPISQTSVSAVVLWQFSLHGGFRQVH